MKTKIEPMASWSIWAGGLSLIMVVVTRTHLIKGFQADNTGMSAVIAAVFGAGLVISYLAARQLQSEWKVMREIEKTNNIPIAKSENDLASVFGKLVAFREKGELVSVHNAIDTYHSKHNSRVRSVSILAALVISMGLLGTVIGLIMSISGLGGMVENIGLSRTTMMEALKATVAGMGTAFYTTFFGALGGLILRAVAVSQLNSLSELCAEATEYADAHLTAKFESKEEELNKQVAKIAESFGAMQKEIESITVKLSESFETTMTSFGEALAEAGNHAIATTKECMTGMTDQMDAFGGEVGKSIESFNESIEESGQKVLESISTVGTSIEEAGSGIREAIVSVNSSIEKSGEDLEGAFGGLNQTLATAGENVQDSFNGLNEAVKASDETVSGSLADFKLSLDGTTQELKDAVGELHAAICEATGEMKVLSKARLDADANEIAGHLSLAADSIQQFLGKKQSDENSQRGVA